MRPSAAALLATLAIAFCAHAADPFVDTQAWKVVVSDDVTAQIAPAAAPDGKGLHLAFNFNGKAGWAMAQRPFPLVLPENFEIVLRIRGDARPNDLQFKLTDASGENVWWFRKTDYVVPKDWETLRIRKRDIEFAWGTLADHELRSTAVLEIGFAAGHGGGAGSLELASFSLNGLSPQAPQTRVATPNEVLLELARNSPRGEFPRAFVGEQNYWTIVGVDGGAEEGMLSEDAAFELRKAAPSLEPFLTVDGAAYDWSNVKATQRLLDRYLPMPIVRWAMPGGTLETLAYGAGERGADFGVVRYQYSNTTQREQAVTLAIAVRPIQVNPHTQFLNGAGGAAPIRELLWDGRMLSINGTYRVIPLAAAGQDLFTARRFDAAPTPRALLREPVPATQLTDDSGFASGAFIYRRRVAAGKTFTVAMLTPWAIDAANLPQGAENTQWLMETERRTASTWHQSLDRVGLRGPQHLQPVLDTLRTALAHILINRDGPGLQPGSRSYERSWIRDGALSTAALVRLGHAETGREFLNWYAQYLFSNGKVPCCVDFRGADPVPENDSPGEFLWLVAELQRYTHDRAALERVWPQVEAATGYLEKLRLSERTAAQRGTPFYGLLPASISHEGYSAKPMHSYWDDSWGLAGYDSAVDIARDLEKRGQLKSWTSSRNQFREDVRASLLAAMKARGIDFLPGSAELGDFDATSTTIALAPIGAGDLLPQRELRNTFERYWTNFVERRDRDTQWSVYTPYEIRTIGSFIRLGWRERADELLDYFMKDRRPAGWNQWAEVVARLAREPHFIGDMPHGWVASDFIRSVLDMFAYEREKDGSLVLAAGIDPRWLDGEGIAIEGLHTPWGLLSYTLRRDTKGELMLNIAAGIDPPGGFLLAVGATERHFDHAPVSQVVELKSVK